MGPVNFRSWLSVKTYTTLLICLTCAFLMADQSLLAPNMSAAAKDFGFSDKERDLYLGGYLSAAFFSIGAPAAILFGRLADKHSRQKLLFIIVILGEAPCILTYWVTAFWQLFILRMLTGISLGGSMPIFYSLLGDMYGTTRRLSATTLLQLALVIGIGAGQGFAGAVGASNWRLPFVLIAIPTIVLAFLALFTIWEPPRGSSEEVLQHLCCQEGGFQFGHEACTWQQILAPLLCPTNILVLLQNIPGNLPLASLMTFSADYLHQQRGLSVGQSSTIIMLFTLGIAAGVAGGGFGGQALYNRWKPSLGLLAGIAYVLAAPPTFWLLNSPLKQTSWALILLACTTGGFCAGIPFAISSVMVVNISEPAARGVVTGLQAVVGDLFTGFGPFMVALMITSMGRAGALNVTIAAWFPAGLLMLLTAFTIVRDEERMQARLLAQATSAAHKPLLGSVVSVELPEGVCDSSHEEAACKAEEGRGNGQKADVDAVQDGALGLLKG